MFLLGSTLYKITKVPNIVKRFGFYFADMFRGAAVDRRDRRQAQPGTVPHRLCRRRGHLPRSAHHAAIWIS